MAGLAGLAPENAAGAQNPVKCLGRTATIVGTPKADTIRGTAGPDVIHGLGGNDLILGLSGNDIICGGRGWDRLYGQLGSDQLVGGPGEDRLFGGSGKFDICLGGTQTDRASRCEGRVSVRPFKLIVADSDVTRQSLRRINVFRSNNADFEAPLVNPPTLPDSLAPLYLSNGHNKLAEGMLQQKIDADNSTGVFQTSRVFRFLPEFNSLGVVQSNCLPLAQRPTTALPGLISQSLVGSADLKVLVTRPTSDRVGIAWQERNECLYWVIVLGGPLVPA